MLILWFNYSDLDLPKFDGEITVQQNTVGILHSHMVLRPLHLKLHYQA